MPARATMRTMIKMAIGQKLHFFSPAKFADEWSAVLKRPSFARIKS